MALKLGDLVAVLRTDNRPLKQGLEQGERDFKQTARKLEDDSKKSGTASALGFLGSLGAQFGQKLPGVVGGVFSGLPPQVQGTVALAAAAVGAVFVTAMGAAITAGILLALGGGVLAIGITQAIKDPAVAGAWKSFGDTAKESLSGFTDAFKGPVARAAKTFGDAMKRMEPTFTAIGKSMAPIIDKLAPAFASLAEKAMPGIQLALEKSKPLFDVLAKHAPKIGDAISLMFGFIAEGAPGAEMFFDHLLSALEFLLPFVGATFAALAMGYEQSIKNAKAFKDFIVGAFNGVVDFFKKLPGRISRAASGLWNGIKDSFKAAVNWVIRKWNDFELKLPSVSFLGATVGGGKIGTPNIPMLATGGHILGAGAAIVGERGPELLHMPRGATVQPLASGQAMAGLIRLLLSGEFRIRGGDLVLVLREQVATRGGNVQAVVGTSG